MSLHYGKHHATYIENYNKLIDKGTKSGSKFKFNEGGHLNHEFFWETMAPTG